MILYQPISLIFLLTKLGKYRNIYLNTCAGMLEGIECWWGIPPQKVVRHHHAMNPQKSGGAESRGPTYSNIPGVCQIFVGRMHNGKVIRKLLAFFLETSKKIRHNFCVRLTLF